MIRFNPERRRRTFVLRFGEWYSEIIRGMPCWVAGCDSRRTKTECAHVVSRGAGGLACHLVPLCNRHHAEYDDGKAAFEAKHHLDLRAHAGYLWERYRDRDPECREAVEAALAKVGDLAP